MSARVSAATSAVMRANRRRDTSPELAVRALAAGAGARYRLDVRGLPGRPDLANARRRWAIFVNGCFWHDHGCGRGGLPRTRASFWREKFARNALRDAFAVTALRAAGWRVLTVWECEIERGRGAGAVRRFLGGAS